MSNTSPLAANTVLKKVYDETTEALNVNLVGDEDARFLSGTATTPSISDSSATVLAANSNRKYAIISNNQGFTAYLSLGGTAVVGSGIILKPDERYEIKKENLWTGSIQAIKGTSTSSNLEVFEAT